MSNRVTIKDIAAAAGVSLGTVHLALSDKTGVSPATRERIRALAKEMDYHPNAAAAALKRKTIHLAVCFPSISGDNRYYYPQLWNGFRAYKDRIQDMNVSIREFAYPENDSNDEKNLRQRQQDVLGRLQGLLDAGELDGLVLHGNRCPFTAETLRGYVDKGLVLVLTDTDMPESGRLLCVAADYDSIGRTMAEIIMSRIPSCGSILLCAGIPEYASHRLIEEGFDAYMQENGHENLVYKEHSNQICGDTYQSILEQVKRPDLAAACCVSSRTSVMLAKALCESGKVGRLVAVGSDLFEENKQALRDGVFQNLVQKNPYAQAFMATRLLVEYLLRDIRPEQLFVVGSQIVFRSNLSLFEKNSVRFLE
ncbi:MAG: substrate-binding domain-containing protein [Eubacteriales bacterium]|nr:substrate-binding domain-containing protein [Eubacteriales bacterium]